MYFLLTVWEMEKQNLKNKILISILFETFYYSWRNNQIITDTLLILISLCIQNVWKKKTTENHEKQAINKHHCLKWLHFTKKLKIYFEKKKIQKTFYTMPQLYFSWIVYHRIIITIAVIINKSNDDYQNMV